MIRFVLNNNIRLCRLYSSDCKDLSSIKLEILNIIKWKSDWKVDIQVKKHCIDDIVKELTLLNTNLKVFSKDMDKLNLSNQVDDLLSLCDLMKDMMEEKEK